MKISRNSKEELWLSAIYLKYVFGQTELDEETVKHCFTPPQEADLRGTIDLKQAFTG